MATVFVLLGGNESDRFFYLHEAAEHIAAVMGTIVAKSAFYETESWGFESNAFLNQVLRLETSLNPTELLALAQGIELKLGRIAKTGNLNYQARCIDIDLLFYDNWVINEPYLTIPHKSLHQRRFTLEPLCEIAPSLVHPVLGKTIQELLAECEDRCMVKRL